MKSKRRPPSGTVECALKNQTPFRVEYGPEGVLLLGSCHEMRRNNIIEELQGTRNRFIDHPKRVEDLEF